MLNLRLQRAVLLLSCAAQLTLAQTIAQADVISAEQYLNTIDRRATLDRVSRALARKDVQRALEHYGVDPSAAVERVAALNDEELMQLSESLDELPAGGSLLGTIGIVAIVLLILEVVGVIDIFKKI
jgi:hypothetical protein